MINVGIIGLGMMGQMHLAAWTKTKGAKVAMIADSDPRRAAGDFSGSWSNIEGGADSIDMSKVRATGDPMELIHDPGVDVIDICVPTPFHADLALAAIASGKHVICEKPMARTYKEAAKVARAAEAAKGYFLPAMCIRFWPEWDWLAKAVASEKYGKVIAASFQRIGTMPPGWFINGDMSGGALLDLHLHDTDFVHHAFGAPSAVSTGGWVGPSGCLDHMHTRYIYPDGPIVTAEGSWAASPNFPFEMSYRVVFEKATADYKLGRQEGSLLLHGPRKSSVVRCAKHDGYHGELAYLVDCIKKGRPPERVTATHAARSIAITEAEDKSARSGRIVTIKQNP